MSSVLFFSQFGLDTFLEDKLCFKLKEWFERIGHLGSNEGLMNVGKCRIQCFF